MTFRPTRGPQPATRPRTRFARAAGVTLALALTAFAHAQTAPSSTPAAPRAEAALLDDLRAQEARVGADAPALLPALYALARRYQEIGAARLAESITLWTRILAIEERAFGPEDARVARSLNELALSYADAGRYEQALPLYRRSLAIKEKTSGPDDPSVALSLNNLAVLLLDMGRHAEALPLFERGLAIDEKVHGRDHPEVAVSLGNLAQLYDELGRYAEALPRFQRSLAIREKAFGPDHPVVARGLANLGLLYRKLGRADEALALYLRALAIHERALGPEHRDVATSANRLASLHHELGRYDDALPLYRRSLAINEKLLGPQHEEVAASVNNLATLYRNMRRYDEALPLQLRSVALFESALGPDHPRVAASLGNLAALYASMGRTADAVRLYERAERIAAARGDRELLWRSQAGLRDAHARAQPALAIFWGKQAVNTIQSLRMDVATLDRDVQRSFLGAGDKRSAYADLADLLIAQGRIPEAQQVMSLLKEEEYFDFVRRDAGVAAGAGKVALTGLERAAQERYDAARGRLAALMAEDAELERGARGGTLGTTGRERLRAIEPELAAARAAFDTFVAGLATLLAGESGARRTDAIIGRIESQQNVLADLGEAGRGVAAVQFVASSQRLHIIVGTIGGQIAREVALPQAELNRRIAAFREAVQDPRRDPRPLGRELHALLIAPIQADLQAQGVHTLMLSLDGALRYVPFAALVDGDTYLIERYRLAIYTEAAKSRLAAARQPSWQVAALGVTRAFPEQNFSALPAVRDELTGIVEGVLPGTAALDDQFTLNALRAGLGTPVLHIASHFRFVPGSEASFLLLGDGSALTLRQIRTELPRFTNVDLLTLSACDTAVGGGHNADGREVEGLGVLAQKQGAKAVLATLWAVADRSTGELMRAFYRAGRATNTNKAEALRLAQLALLRGQRTDGAMNAALDASARGASRTAGARAEPVAAFTPDAARPYAHPFYWAPFILMGNWL